MVIDDVEAMGVDSSGWTIEESAQAVKLTKEQMKLLQDQDGYCSRIRKQMRNAMAENGTFVNIDSLLYRIPSISESLKERLRQPLLVIPLKLQLTVLVNLHKELGHGGRDKMMSTLQKRLYWKGMSKQVREFVRGCKVCNFRHLVPDVRKPIRIKPPVGPGIRLALDIWSAKQYHALTAMCLHSMYPFVVPIKDKTAEEVCDKFQTILSCMRTPREVLTDNGPEFTSGRFKELCEQRGINNHRRGAPNHPANNGVLERFHRYLNAALHIATNFSKKGEWWPAVRAAVEVYRKVPHTATGESPLFLFTAQEPTYSFDHLLPTDPKDIFDPEGNKLDLAQLRVAYALARKNTCLARQKNKVVLRKKPQELKIGDRVYRRDYTKGRSKVDPRWLPGYRIVDRETGRTMIVEHTNTGTKARVNICDLKWADPVSELLGNSSLDVFPGCSKLYFQAGDLPNLDWPGMENLPPLEPEVQSKLEEAVRDRRNDVGVQEDPQSTGSQQKAAQRQEGEGRSTRAKRIAPVPIRYRNDLGVFMLQK